MKSTNLTTRRWEMAKWIFRRELESHARIFGEQSILDPYARRILWGRAYESAKRITDSSGVEVPRAAESAAPAPAQAFPGPPDLAPQRGIGADNL